MTYIRVSWDHSLPDEPVLMFSEFGDQRLETRKVEVFRDGRRGWAGAVEEAGGTRLGTVPVSSLDDIARDPQFDPYEIDAAEFEAEWRRCSR